MTGFASARQDAPRRERSDVSPFALPAATLAALFLVATFLHGLPGYPLLLAGLALLAAVQAFSGVSAAAVLVVGTPALDSYGIIARTPQTLTVFQIVLLATLCGAAFRAIRRGARPEVRLTIWDLGIALLLLAAAISVPGSVALSRSVVAFIEVACLAGLYLVVSRAARRPEDRDAVILTVIATAAYSSVIALTQVFWTSPVVPLLEQHATGSTIAPLRVAAFFGNPNTLGVFLVLAALLAFERALRATSRSLMALYFAAMAVCTVATGFTFSREAYVGMVVGAAALLVAVRPRGRIVVAAFVSAALVVAVLVAASGIGDRAASLFAPTADPSTMNRAYLAGTSARIFFEHPLTGVGISAFMTAYPSYADPRVPSSFIVTDPHQMPLGLPAETGVVGLLAEVSMLAALAFLLLRMRRLALARRSPVAPIAAALAFFVMACFNWFVFFESFWTVLSLVGGIALVEGYWLYPVRDVAGIASPEAPESARA